MRLLYLLSEGVRGFFRERKTNSYSVVIIAISLIIFGVFLLITLNLYQATQQIRKKVEIEAYLLEGVNKKEALALQKKIESVEGVKKTYYIDKKQAAAYFKEAFGDDLLKAVSENPLPASIKVKISDKFKTSDRIAEIAERIKGYGGIEEVTYGRKWVEKLDSFILVLFFVDLLIGLVISIASVLVVSNVVGLAILSRRESIEIMKLVGATDRFIKLPFFVEGIIGGFLGGFVASAMLYLAYRWALFQFPHFLFAEGDIPVLLMIPLGIVFGGIGSWMSLNRILERI